MGIKVDFQFCLNMFFLTVMFIFIIKYSLWLFKETKNDIEDKEMLDFAVKYKNHIIKVNENTPIYVDRIVNKRGLKLSNGWEICDYRQTPRKTTEVEEFPEELIKGYINPEIKFGICYWDTKRND